MAGNFSPEVTMLLSLVASSIVVVEIKTFLICYVISQDHAIRWSRNFIRGRTLMICHHTAKFGGHKHCGKRDINFSICYVTSLDHLFKGLCDLIGGVPHSKARLCRV